MTRIAEDIAEIKTDMKWVKSTLKLHISYHFMVRLAMLTTLIASGTAILIALL